MEVFFISIYSQIETLQQQLEAKNPELVSDLQDQFVTEPAMLERFADIADVNNDFIGLSFGVRALWYRARGVVEALCLLY